MVQGDAGSVERARGHPVSEISVVPIMELGGNLRILAVAVRSKGIERDRKKCDNSIFENVLGKNVEVLVRDDPSVDPQGEEGVFKVAEWNVMFGANC
jgi:hypothetical protein